MKSRPLNARRPVQYGGRLPPPGPSPPTEGDAPRARLVKQLEGYDVQRLGRTQDRLKGLKLLERDQSV